LDIRDYWSIIWKRKFVVVVSVLALLVVGVIHTFVILKATYESTAQVLVDQPNRVIVLTNASDRIPQPLSVETQKKLLKSRPVAERAAKILKIDPKNKSFAYSLINQIIATSDEDTGIIRVTMRSQFPKQCTDIVNAYAHAFEEISRELAEKTNQETMAYLKEQLDNAETALAEKEKNLYGFNVRNGVVLLNEEIMKKNATISDLETERVSKMLDANQLEARLNNIRELFRGKSLRIMQNSESFVNDTLEIEALRGNINEAQVKRASLLVKYKPGHPIVRTLDSEIDQYEKQLEKYISDSVNHRIVSPGEYNEDRKLIADLETQVLVTRSKITNLDYLINKLKQEQMNYPKLQYEYTRLMREKDIAEKLFLMLYEQHQKAQIEEVQRDVKVRVFDEARVPTQPISPNRPKNLAVAAMLGLMIGIAISFLLEEMEETVRTSDDVKNYLNLPVLGSIPYSAETINKLIVDVPLKSPIAEAYRRLSFFTQLFCLDPPIKTLLITSSKSDEGKSTTLANLAISMAQEGTKVLIVDTDLRRPMLHRMFGVDNSLGVSSILTGELEAEIAISDLSVSGYLPKESFMDAIVDRLIQPASIKGLTIIPSGPLPANSVELLRSERMLAFLRTIEKKADIVMFDSPPSIHVIDAVVMSQILDGVLFVINSGRINRDEALQVKYMIESTKTPIIGVALNNIEVSSPDYYYYYYYGGYGYGSKQRRKRVKLKR
jgi:tyrosine-protein kinase Etk/Wzc